MLWMSVWHNFTVTGTQCRDKTSDICSWLHTRDTNILVHYYETEQDIQQRKCIWFNCLYLMPSWPASFLFILDYEERLILFLFFVFFGSVIVNKIFFFSKFQIFSRIITWTKLFTKHVDILSTKSRQLWTI